MDIERKQTTPRELPISKLSRYPPTPPESEGDFTSSNSSRSGSISISNDIGSSEYDEATFTFPLAPPTVNPTKTLDIDLDTPDAHVPRDPRLIRLTGVHPFNVEAPLSDLYNSGFLTPPELFYVRNHGAVPEVLDEDIPQWDVTVEGYFARNKCYNLGLTDKAKKVW